MKVTDWIRTAGRGLIESAIPNIFSGMLTGWLTDQKITSATVVQWVKEDKSLLTLFLEYRPDGTEAETILQRASQWVTETEWLTRDYMIQSLRNADDRSVRAIASLVLGWDDAAKWIDKQIAEIKNKFEEVNSLKEPEAPPVLDVEEFRCQCGETIIVTPNMSLIECPKCQAKYRKKEANA